MIPLLLTLADPASAQDWHVLAGADARATSFLKSNWNRYEENYHPSYALDDDPLTGWVEGVDGTGEGQALEWTISAITSARAVKVSVRNGYQKSDALLAANAAPKDVEVALLDGGGAVVATQRATLQKVMGWQDVLVNPPKNKAFSAVRVTVASTWPGKKYQDTVISDVAVAVDSDVPYNAAAEEAKRRRLAEWIRGRKEVAAYFASLPVEYPFVGSHSATTDVQDSEHCVPGAVAPTLQPMWDTYERLHAGSASWYKRTVAVPLIPPDGLGIVGEAASLVDARRVTWFQANAEVAGEKKGDEGLQERISWSNDRVEWATPPVPTAVSFWQRTRGVERTSYDVRQEWVVGYDVEGKATWILLVRTEPEDGRSDFAATLHRNEAGRIDRADLVYYEYGDGRWDEGGAACSVKKAMFSP